MAHLAILTEAVRSLISELKDSGIRLSVDLPSYTPPARRVKRAKPRTPDTSSLTTWTAQSMEAPFKRDDTDRLQSNPETDAQKLLDDALSMPLSQIAPRSASFGLEDSSAWTGAGIVPAAGHTTDFMHDIFNFSSAARTQPDIGYSSVRLEEPALGSQDARPNIIKKGIINNATARHLVTL